MSIHTQAELNGVKVDLEHVKRRMEELGKVKPETVQELFSDYSSRLSILYKRVDELERILRAISNKFDKLLDRV